MESFYQNVPADAAAEIEQTARLMYDIRSARDEVLGRLGATDADHGLRRIVDGELPEHPGYEHYLSARILADLHAQVRADLAARIQEVREQ